MKEVFSGIPAASIASIVAFKSDHLVRAGQRAVLFQGSAVILDATRMSEVSSWILAALATSSAVFKPPQEEYRVRNKEVRSQAGAATLTLHPIKEEFSGTLAAYPVKFVPS